MNQNLFTIGRSNYVSGALLSAKPNDILGPLKTDRGYAIIRAIGSTKIDSVNFQQKEDALFRLIYTEKQNNLYPDWVRDQKEKADIVDNRKYFF